MDVLRQTHAVHGNHAFGSDVDISGRLQICACKTRETLDFMPLRVSCLLCEYIETMRVLGNKVVIQHARLPCLARGFMGDQDVLTIPINAAMSPPGSTWSYMCASSVAWPVSISRGFCGLMKRTNPCSRTGLNTMILHPRFTAR